MKKICSLMIAFLVLSAGAAFGQANVIGAGQIITAINAAGDYTLGPPNAFAKLSTGVSLGFNTSAGTYAISTKHVNGDKCYGAAANDGKNYWQDCSVNSPATQPGQSDSQSFDGWSSL